MDYIRDGKVFLPVQESKKSFLFELHYYGFESVKEESIDENTVATSLPGRSTIVLGKLIATWKTEITKSKQSIFVWEVCIGILDTFLKQRVTGLCRIEFQRDQRAMELSPFCGEMHMEECNKYLRLAGIQLVNGPRTQSPDKLCIQSPNDDSSDDDSKKYDSPETVTIDDAYIELITDSP